MNTLAIAIRNVARNARRSSLTAFSLVVGTVAILLFGGYVNDNIYGLQTITVRSQGHLQIVRNDYLDFGRGDPGRFSIPAYESLVSMLRADPVLAPMLTVVTPVLNVEGVAGNFGAGVSSNFAGEGVVPSEHAALLAWDGFHIGIPPGKGALKDDKPEGGVIGFRMAQLLSLCGPLNLSGCKTLPAREGGDANGPEIPADIAALGKLGSTAARAGGEPPPVSVELLASSPSGRPNVVRMNVLQAERQAIRELDSLYVAMPLPVAQRLVFGPDEKAVSSVVIQLRSTDLIDAAEARVRKILPNEDMEVLTFHDASPIYDQIVASYESVFQFIAVLMGVIALFSIANAVNMAVGERVGEIGTLRALGFQRSAIRSIFLFEGALLGAIGTASGAVIALIAELTINSSGLSWTPPGRSSGIPLRVDVIGHPKMIVITVISLSVVACVSAFWPSNRAAKLEVTEALRHV